MKSLHSWSLLNLMSPQKQKHVQKVQVQLDSTCGSGPGIEKIREGE